MLIIAAILILGSTSASFAHDAPSGWKYPFTCCSNTDCREEKRVHEVNGGWLVPSGEVLPFGDTRLKDSPDGEFHWCTSAGMDNTNTLCLFVPPRGM